VCWAIAVDTFGFCGWFQVSKQIASSIMRTTIDIDDLILEQIKAVHERDGGSLSAAVTKLLLEALDHRRAAASFCWTSRPMKALVDLENKQSVSAADPS
jgi:hypothetical protein